MSSISRRRNGLMALSVIGAPVLGEVFAPRSQDRTPASATPRDPSLATDYRGSGLVLRRISPIGARPDDGLLSEPTAGTQPWRREPLFMPRYRALPRTGSVGQQEYGRHARQAQGRAPLCVKPGREGRRCATTCKPCASAARSSTFTARSTQSTSWRP